MLYNIKAILLGSATIFIFLLIVALTVYGFVWLSKTSAISTAFFITIFIFFATISYQLGIHLLEKHEQKGGGDEV